MRNQVGMVLSQEGIPVKDAPDYQRVLDTRWKYLEIAEEIRGRVTLPAMAAGATQITRLARNPMGFVPFFMDDIPRGYRYMPIGETPVEGFDPIGPRGGISVRANKQEFSILRRALQNTALPAVELSFTLYVFNIDALEEYEAPNTKVTDASGKSNIGVKNLQGREKDINSTDPMSYSINTHYKSLSIAKHGVAHINADLVQSGTTAYVSSVNTNTDVLNIDLNHYYTQNPPSWFQTTGNAVKYTKFISGGAKTIGGLLPAEQGGGEYYVIANTPTTFKLARTQSEANNGIAIDLVTNGGGGFYAVSNPNDPSDIIPNNTGYAPSFLFAKHIDNETIASMTNPFAGVFHIDREFVRVSAPFSLSEFTLSYIILKDPIGEPL